MTCLPTYQLRVSRLLAPRPGLFLCRHPHHRLLCLPSPTTVGSLRSPGLVCAHFVSSGPKEEAQPGNPPESYHVHGLSTTAHSAFQWRPLTLMILTDLFPIPITLTNVGSYYFSCQPQQLPVQLMHLSQCNLNIKDSQRPFRISPQLTRKTSTAPLSANISKQPQTALLAPKLHTA
jgi:hypothetical protein